MGFICFLAPLQDEASTAAGEVGTSGAVQPPPKHPGDLGCWGAGAEPPRGTRGCPAGSISAPHGRGCVSCSHPQQLLLAPRLAMALSPPAGRGVSPPRSQRFPGGAEPRPGAPQLVPSVTFRCVSPPKHIPRYHPGVRPSPSHPPAGKQGAGGGGLIGRAAPAALGAR